MAELINIYQTSDLLASAILTATGERLPGTAHTAVPHHIGA